MKFQGLILLSCILSAVSCSFADRSKSDEKDVLAILGELETTSYERFVDSLGEYAYSVSFEVKAEAEDLEVFEDGIVPWVSIEDPGKDMDRLVDPDQVVVSDEKVTLVIDYPVSKPVKSSLESGEGFTRRELILKISEHYHQMYKEEEETANTKTVPMEERTGLINRNQTDGKYGIWGHDLGDLDLSGIDVYKSGDGVVSLMLMVES